MTRATHNVAHEKQMLNLMETAETKTLLKEHKLRRSKSPLHLWRESHGTPINIHETGIKGVLRPLGVIHISKNGHLIVDHNYAVRTAKYEKLFYFAQALANKNRLTTTHQVKR